MASVHSSPSSNLPDSARGALTRAAAREVGKEPISRAACGRRRLLRRALPLVESHLVAHGIPDGIGDRELAVAPGKLSALVKAAREGGIVEALKVLENVSPRVQSGIEHRDAGHATAELLPTVHQEEAGGGAGGLGLEACEKEMKMSAARAFAVLGAQGPEQLRKIPFKASSGAAQERIPSVVSLAFGQALTLESERAEELPLDAVKDVDLRDLHASPMSGCLRRVDDSPFEAESSAEVGLGVVESEGNDLAGECAAPLGPLLLRQRVIESVDEGMAGSDVETGEDGLFDHAALALVRVFAFSNDLDFDEHELDEGVSSRRP